MNNILVFDIETVADVEGYRKLQRLAPDISNQDVYRIMSNERLSETGTTFMRHHLQKVVAISLALKRPHESLKIWTLGREGSPEKTIIERFFHGLEQHTPTLVSWNGGGFDLPVLHYRALIHGVTAQRYFEVGERDNQFKFKNYFSRYHWRHIDLMDVLSGYQARSVASLDEIAKLCGFPGKLDIDGSAVQDYYHAGEIDKICDYCETDVLNTYLLFLRFELLRGTLNAESYQQQVAHVVTFLKERHQKSEHFEHFLRAWQGE